MICASEVLAGLTFLEIHAPEELRQIIADCRTGVETISAHARREALKSALVDGRLDLSVRVLRRLQTLGIVTIGELCERTATQLVTRRNASGGSFGKLNLRQVREELGKLGLSLSGEEKSR